MIKARYWVGVCYPENMVDNWQEKIGDLLQLPYAYCVHDKDLENDTEENRKIHVHIIIVFGNTTTDKSALKAFNKLSAEGKVCCPFCEDIISIRNKYNYLIHDTEDCKKKNKHLYNKNERITGNCFDIGSYVQLSTAEKEDILDELDEIVIGMNFENVKHLLMYVKSNYDIEYRRVLRSNITWFSQLCKGNFLENHSRR